jgi:hypothetical protein
MMEMVAAINILIKKGYISREELTQERTSLLQKYTVPSPKHDIQPAEAGPDVGSSGHEGSELLRTASDRSDTVGDQNKNGEPTGQSPV